MDYNHYTLVPPSGRIRKDTVVSVFYKQKQSCITFSQAQNCLILIQTPHKGALSTGKC